MKLKLKLRVEKGKNSDLKLDPYLNFVWVFVEVHLEL